MDLGVMALEDIYLMSFILLTSWVILFFARVNFCFIHIMLAVLTLSFIGVFLYGYPNLRPSIVFGIGMNIFSLGVFSAKHIFLRSSKRINIPKLNISTFSQKKEALVLLSFSIPVIIGASLLFVLGGIPLLSSEGNISRFTVSDGLGVPTRLLKFGLPFLLIISAVYWLGINNPKKIFKTVFLILLSSIAIGFILLGNKGAFLVIVELLIAILTTLIIQRRIKKKVFMIVSALAALGIYISILITKQILNVETGEATQIILERMTAIAGMGFYEIVEYYTPLQGFQLGLGQWNSFLDFLSTLRLYPRGEVTFLGLELAHAVLGVPLGVHAFIFPITITPFGDFYYDFGVVGVIFGAFILGFLSFYLYYKTLLTVKPIKKAFLIFLQFELMSYSSKGSLFGLINNEILSVMLIMLMYIIYRNIVLEILTSVGKKNYKTNNIKYYSARNFYIDSD
ncbi:O-antigen polymerase [Aeribacillus alveayuensis]|uniref:Oligosaccharide repeat unit polymerase n=1 Tax=Aeribacillus alveayuensis TaxID=279215 RepID=A0ABT9VNK6_9BACI|nr:oligosaccharide repeat unit polymerase [Bacillus alveayuensis]